MYSVKWVEKNLGITRKTIRYYEEQGLIPKNNRNPLNDYRDYDEDDINRIWAVKTLIKIGFTAKELRSLISNRCINFYDVLSNKVDILEKNYTECGKYYELAKTIKITGRIPTVTEFGNISFDDFIAYTCENFNYSKQGNLSDALYISEKFNNHDASTLTDDDIEKIERITRQGQLYTFHAYLKVLSKLSDLKCTDEAVQKVVDLIYIDFCEFLNQEGLNSDISKKRFADNMLTNFYDDGDIAKSNKAIYGEKECEFIAVAITHFSEK